MSSLSGQTILITGAGGFIGSSLSKKLLSYKAVRRIVGIDNLDNYYSSAVKMLRIKELEIDKRFTFVKTSIHRVTELGALTKKYQPSMLIHAAGCVGVRAGERDPVKYIRTNILGTQCVLSAINHPNLKHVLLLSSSSVYGGDNVPQNENRLITYSTPRSLYGSSKAAMEFVAYRFHTINRCPTTIIRAFSVYGPDGRPDMLPMKVILSALAGTPVNKYGNDSNNKRDWTYVDDLVDGMTRILATPKTFEIVNLGRGKPMGIDSVFSIMTKILQTQMFHLRVISKPQNPEEVNVTCADISKAQSAYGYFPITSFENGFEHTLSFFLKNRSLTMYS